MDRSEPNSPAVKTAVVTGGSRGHRSARSCWRSRGRLEGRGRLPLSDLEAKETLEAAEAAGGTGVAVRLDTARRGLGERGVPRVSPAALGPVVGLVNNAGLSVDGLALKYPMDTFEDVMATNVRGSFLCARSALRGMLKAKWGRIVQRLLAVALRGNAGQTVYAASKTALVGITRSLAREVGAKGITVNAIAPGLVDTDMTSHLTSQARDVYVEPDTDRQNRHTGGDRERRAVPHVRRGVLRERRPRARRRRADGLTRPPAPTSSRRSAYGDARKIDSRVRKVLAEQLAVDESQVVPDARFAEDLNADSLDLVEAVLALEEEWGIEIPEEEMDGVKTVGEAVEARRVEAGRQWLIVTSSSPASGRSRRSEPASRTSGKG